MDAAAWTFFLILWVYFSSATANHHHQIWAFPPVGEVSYLSNLISADMVTVAERKERVLERGAFPYAHSQPDGCCKTLPELPQLLTFLLKRLVKHYINCILKVDANRPCSFPKAAEQLLSGEWSCTSSWEEGVYFKPAIILGFCSWQLHWLGWELAPVPGKKNKRSCTPWCHPITALMNGTWRCKCFETSPSCISPPMQLLWQAKEPWELPPPRWFTSP